MCGFRIPIWVVVSFSVTFLRGPKMDWREHLFQVFFERVLVDICNVHGGIVFFERVLVDIIVHGGIVFFERVLVDI